MHIASAGFRMLLDPTGAELQVGSEGGGRLSLSLWCQQLWVLKWLKEKGGGTRK